MPFAALVLLPFVVLRQRSARANVLESEATPPLRSSAPLLRVKRTAAPLLIGVALFAGYSFQTAGLHLTTPAKAGFITGLSVVIVPLFAALILRQPPSRNAWLGVGLAVVGLGLLTLQAGLGVEVGDLLVLCCAVAFAAHILLTGHYAPRYDPLRLTLGSLVTVAVLSGAAALIFDRPWDPAALTPSVLFAAAFTGVFATSVAFVLQTQAQRFTTSTHTALDLRGRAGVRRPVQLPADRRGVGGAASARSRADSRGDGGGGDEAGSVTRDYVTRSFDEECLAERHHVCTQHVITF